MNKMFLLMVSALFLFSCAKEVVVDEHKPVDVGPGERDALTEKSAELHHVGAFAHQSFKRETRFYGKDRPTIKGQCRIQTVKSSNIEVPCQNVIVVLNNAKGKAIKKIRAERGVFGFYVKEGNSLSIGIESKKYRLKEKKSVAVEIGDKPLLVLVPK